MKSPIGVLEGFFDLTVEGEELTGSIHLMDGDSPITNGSLDDDEFTFKFHGAVPKFGEMDFTVLGEEDDGKITGKLKCSMMTLRFNGSRE